MDDPVKLEAFLSGEFDRLDVHARGRLSLAEIKPALLRLAEIQGLTLRPFWDSRMGGRGGGSGGGGSGAGERRRGGSRGGSGGSGSWGSSGECGGGRSGAGGGGREVLPGKGKNDDDLVKGLFVSFMSADLSSEIGRRKFVSVCRDVILASQESVEVRSLSSFLRAEDPLPRLLEGSTPLRELFNDADEVDEFIDALWTRMDLDGDGTVTMHEIRPMLPALGLFPQPLPISTGGLPVRGCLCWRVGRGEGGVGERKVCVCVCVVAWWEARWIGEGAQGGAAAHIRGMGRGAVLPPPPHSAHVPCSLLPSPFIPLPSLPIPPPLRAPEQEDEILTELLQTYAGWGGVEGEGGAQGENGAEEGGVDEGESDSAGGGLEAFENGSGGLEGSSSSSSGGGGGGGGGEVGAVDFSMGLSKVQFMWLLADILFTVAQGLEDDPLYLPANMTILNRPFLLKVRPLSRRLKTSCSRCALNRPFLLKSSLFHHLTDRMFLSWDTTNCLLSHSFVSLAPSFLLTSCFRLTHPSPSLPPFHKADSLRRGLLPSSHRPLVCFLFPPMLPLPLPHPLPLPLHQILSDEAFFHRLTDRMFLTWDETDRGMLSRAEVVAGFYSLGVAYGLPAVTTREEADSIYLSLFLTADCDTSGFVDREEFQSLMHSIFLGAALQLQAARLPPQPLSPLAPLGPGPGGTSSSLSSLYFFRPFSLSLPSIPFSAALPWGNCADSSTTAFHSSGSSSGRESGADSAAAAAAVADLPTLTGFKLFDGRRVRKMVRADGGACLDVWLNSAFEELVTSTSDSGDGVGGGGKKVRVSGSSSGEAEGIDMEGLTLYSPGGGREKGESGEGGRGEGEREEGLSEGHRNGGCKKVSWSDALGNSLEAYADKDDVSRPTDRPVVTWAALERKLVQQLHTLGMPGEGVSEDWERIVHDMVARERRGFVREEKGGRDEKAEGEGKTVGGEEQEEEADGEEERESEEVWLDKEEFVAVMTRLLKQVGQTLQDTPLLLRSLDGTLIRAFLQHPARLTAAIRSTFQALDNKGWGGMPAARLVPALRVIGLSAGLPCRG
ncbi:unnamed protein product, partial [Closterium sp. NIES-53]